MLQWKASVGWMWLRKYYYHGVHLPPNLPSCSLVEDTKVQFGPQTPTQVISEQWDERGGGKVRTVQSRWGLGTDEAKVVAGIWDMVAKGGDMGHVKEYPLHFQRMLWALSSYFWLWVFQGLIRVPKEHPNCCAQSTAQGGWNIWCSSTTHRNSLSST